MAFNGSGTFSLVAGNPVVTGTTISSTWANNTLSDIANNGLTNCLTKDGQTTASIRIAFAAGISVTGTSVAAPAINLTDSGTGFYRTAANQIGVAVSGSQVANFLSTGVTVTGVATATTSVITPIVDSGSTGALLLKTNNGQTAFQISHIASGVNFLGTAAQPAGSGPFLTSSGADTDIAISYGTKGTQSHRFLTDVFGGAVTQFSILHTASATRNITVTGSNGGNPTIGVTAGELAISTFLRVGTNPGTSGQIGIPYNSGIYSRNSANNNNLPLAGSATTNGVVDTIFIGDANTAGMYWKARSGGAAPTTSDLPSGFATLWRDTGGATTKLYYNNGGSLQSVALA